MSSSHVSCERVTMVVFSVSSYSAMLYSASLPSQKSTLNRKRPLRVKTYLTEKELKIVHKRMAQMGTTNREAYLRKMALDGYILRLEIPELKEYVATQRVHSKRFNEIAKRVNETGRIYPEDISEMKEMVGKLKEQMDLVLAEVNKLK